MVSVEADISGLPFPMGSPFIQLSFFPLGGSPFSSGFFDSLIDPQFIRVASEFVIESRSISSSL